MAEAAEHMDVQLGAVIRRRRRELGVSQSAMGEKIGVSFQQVQKYERGVNRVSFSALVKIADALKCRAVDLVADAEQSGLGEAPRQKHPVECARLVQLFDGIPASDLRQAVLKIAEALAERAARDERH